MNNGNKETNIHNNVSVSAYRDGSNLVGSGNIYQGGIFTIPNIPVNKESDSIY